MRVRDYDELAAAADPAWPVIEQLAAAAAVPVNVVPSGDADSGPRTLYRLQVTVHSFLGAVAGHCGAILVDHGWLRLLGSGLDGLPSLSDANGLGEPTERSTAPGHLIVAYDVLGGTFALNGGGLPGEPGEICYLGPDTLAWTPIGLPGHSGLVQWALAGGIEETFADLRWPGWEEQAEAARPGQGITAFPPLWAAESRDGSAVSRKIISLAELVACHAETARQLAELPDGGRVQIRITQD